MIIETNSASETLALGEKLGKAAKPGQIYTLNGDLGVGKTVLTQGFALRQSSKTFVIRPFFFEKWLLTSYQEIV
jgi:tRNA A37 threonylcarbamoyladenosine biosynthesis protein TsaE